MLMFKRISYKNLLSTGNIPNVVELNKHSSTLITGKNGEGKSTILCALTFALFGKPFRNVNKNQLINSINQKNCVVEVDFDVNGHSYKVIRGIKPNIFEVHCDGVLINQDAALKDYQKVLEQQILKLNYKTFTQVVILGSATFVPFMQLTSNQRRDVIEDILDIKIFSLMNLLLKDQSIDTKNEIQQIESLITSQKTKIQSQKNLIQALLSSKQDAVNNLQQKIEANNLVIDQTHSVVSNINQQIAELVTKQSKYAEVSQAIDKITKAKLVFAAKMDACHHNIKFFNENENCPSCSQHIPDQYRDSTLLELENQIATQQSKFDEASALIEKMQVKMDSLAQVLDQIRDKNIEIAALNNTISVLTKQNTDLRKEIEATQDDTGNIDEEKMKMRDMASEAIEQVQTKTGLLEQRGLQEAASILLKDTGIKTAIIREYLPVMNKLINRYLAAMDFYVKFELDESFNEVIKSRARDEFTYASFSEGEKRRLDLAILFTWRQIAKMKNSVNTNILILDEILDGALDAGGIDYFLSIMNTFGDNTNVFVISHRDVADKFDHVIRFEKKNDFSVISTS